MKKAFNFLTEYSLLLIIGVLIALVWANINYESYHHFVEYPIWDHGFIGHGHFDEDGHFHRTLTLHYLVNDLLMAFFFAVAFIFCDSFIRKAMSKRIKKPKKTGSSKPRKKIEQLVSNWRKD